MNSLVVFAYQNQEIRTFQDKEDNVWFCLADLLHMMRSMTTVSAAVLQVETTLGKEFVSNIPLETEGGKQNIIFVSEPATTFLISRSRTETGKKLNRWIHIEVLPSIRKTGSYAIAPQMPQTFADALRAYADELEAKERLAIENKLLLQENEELSEAVDELFNYSSIIRVAKFNNCSEKQFNWRKLKAVSMQMGLEIKQVPCLRYVTKNLYSHDAWRIAYPDFLLPETTTIRLAS